MWQKVPQPIRTILLRLTWLGGAAVLIAAASVFGGDLYIRLSARNQVFHAAAEVPVHDVAVVLGTSKKVRTGQLNLHFVNRMYAAADLYKQGKVRHILVSGANPSKYYDEPTDMMEFLVGLGVPAEAITRDYAGFRTLDTVVRARKVFGLDEYVIVTDRFHTYRTLFLARQTGAKCVAFAAQDVQIRWSLKSKVRERFANVKALLDIYVLRTKPKFLGPRENIQLAGGPDHSATSH